MKRLTGRFGRYAIAPTLVVAIGLLALLSVGSILALQFYSSTQIVGTLGNRLIARNLQMLELALSRHLDAAVDQGAFIEEALRDGAYQIDDAARFLPFMTGSLAAAPQLNAIVVATPDNRAFRAIRMLPGALPVSDRVEFGGDDPTMKIAVETRTRKSPYWGPPVYANSMGQTVLNYRIPLWRHDAYAGYVAIGIGTEALSDLAEKLSTPHLSTIFILYGDDHVLAAPGPDRYEHVLGRDKPLLPVAEAKNPILSSLSRATPFSRAGLVAPEGAKLSQLEIGGELYLVTTRKITGYGATPLTIGTYSTMRAVDGPLRFLTWSLVAGFVLLLVSILFAIVLGRIISGPIRRTAKQAARIATLDFDEIRPITGSYLREINDLASTFNTMLDGVKSFGRYVPRKLVDRLIHERRIGAGSEERDLTVMFTDIAGFTATCEGMSAGEVAAFINHHFTLVVACIENEGGTIDKYIGDAVMAFWGAPVHMEDAPARACRAAMAIRKAIMADNRARVAAGESPVRMRIGIHRGPLIVGDIGAPARINYTVVGDVVNAAQRLEGLGKEIDSDAEVMILVSADAIRDSGLEADATHQGAYNVKGKEKPIDVFRLA